MISAVFDTNVLASGFVRSREDSLVVRILDAWRQRRFGLVVSQHILDELANTLASPYFRRRLTPGQIEADLSLLRINTTVIGINSEVSGVATHPEDDVILATAISANVDYLVTGDLKLQVLGSYRGVRILSPRDFATLLGEQDGTQG